METNTSSFDLALARMGPKISIRLGLTLPIPGVNFGMVKPEIAIDDIDIGYAVDDPVERAAFVKEQVEWSLQAVNGAMPMIDQCMEMQIANLLAPQVGSTGYADRLTSLETSLSGQRERMNAVVEQINTNTESLAKLLASRIISEAGVVDAEESK